MSTPQPAPKPKRSVRQLKQTVEFPLPELGIVADVRRPQLSGWIAAGKAPDRLLAALALADVQSVALQGEDYKELMSFYLELAKANFEWPKLVDDPDPDSDDELAPGALPLRALGRFGSWVMNGCQGIPVQTTTGEVSADALATFREDTTVQGDSPDGGQVQTGHGETVGDSR